MARKLWTAIVMAVATMLLLAACGQSGAGDEGRIAELETELAAAQEALESAEGASEEEIGELQAQLEALQAELEAEQMAEEGAPSDEVEVTILIYDFGDTNDEAIRRAAIERFNERYPNVTVELQFNTITTWSEYLQQLVTQVAGGNTPDIVHLATEGVKMAVDEELVIPLDAYIDDDPGGQALLGDVAPEMLDSLSVDGELYFLPAAWNNMMIHYNTAVFEEAGIERPPDDWTWDDFIEIAQQLTVDTDGDGRNDKWGFAMPYFFFGVSPWLYSNGTAVMTPDLTASNLDDPKVVEAVQFMHDLVYVYEVTPDPFNTDPNAFSTLFASGDFAMTGGGHWPIQFYQENDFDDYDVLPWPQNTTRATVFGVDGYGIHPDSENPELAYELMKELVSAETLMQTISAGVAIPARRSVAETEGFLAEPAHANLFYESLTYATPVQGPPEYAEMSASFMRWLDMVMADEMPVEEAMQGAHDELMGILSE